MSNAAARVTIAGRAKVRLDWPSLGSLLVVLRPVVGLMQCIVLLLG
jgi:hypothetical protein